MRAAFDRDVNAFLLVGGIPTVAFAVRNHFDREEIDRLHHTLWNQGLANVLVVQLPAEVRVYSLWQRPVPAGTEIPADQDRRLVEILELARQALQIRSLVPALESGQYVEQHRGHFDPKARIDATLLSNLRETLLQLQGLPDDAARALILQIVFIAYLEDRGHIEEEDFHNAVGLRYGRLIDVLSARDPQLLVGLFKQLRKTFNGDVFRAPGVFETAGQEVVLESRHIEPIASFREGKLNMASGQFQFWPYDFKFIPVELISAIYDRFLNEDNEKRQQTGAYFTPRFLADLVVDQLWGAIDPATRLAPFTVLDPACGSALFLVRMFQKIVEEQRRVRPNASPDWDTLRGIVERLHGWDIQESAVLIGVFSLYVAMLEQVHPPAIRALKAEGKVLPRLLDHTLRCRDFFEEEKPEKHFDIIVGNPPWVSKKSEQTRSALKWCQDHRRPAPQGEIAWAFLWKSANHLTEHGRVALLLPAMGVLLNHSRNVNDARLDWLEGIEVLRVINFADVCFQLFEGAKRPTILALYRLRGRPGRDYDIEYWVPKAHRLLSSSRLLIIPSVDRSVVRMSAARTDPAVWKRKMWATDRDLKLLAWLDDLPKLGRILMTHRQARRQQVPRTKWIVGQGFKRFDPASASLHHDFTYAEEVTRYPFLDAAAFRPWVMPTVQAPPWPSAKVHRRGFVDGFVGPHVLIPKGIVRAEGVVRAAYVEQSLCFFDFLHALRFPAEDESRAKILTAVLNSSLAAWYYFHTSANVGADRSLMHEEQLLDLPFPMPEETPAPAKARRAGEDMISLIDDLLSHKDNPLVLLR
jgi:Eco57I restriction-modification methylase